MLIAFSGVVYFGAPKATNYLIDWGIESVVEKVAPSTVHIKYERNGKTWQGSGVIVGRCGTILTARHITEEPGEFTVTLADGRVFKTTKSCVSAEYDVGYLKIVAADLPVAKWGDSDLMKLGSSLILVGSQFGDDHFNSVSLGHISSTHRSKGTPERGWGVLFQTDAAANPGSSGGPAFNREGELVGIVVGGPTSTYAGIVYCVPSNICRSIVDSVRIQFALQEVKSVEYSKELNEFKERLNRLSAAFTETCYVIDTIEYDVENITGAVEEVIERLEKLNEEIDTSVEIDLVTEDEGY